MIITKEWLTIEGACVEGVEWFNTTFPSGSASSTEIISKLRRVDHLLWFLYHAEIVIIRQMVWLACLCGRISLRHVPAGEDRPRLAYEAAEAWVENPSEAAGRAAGWAAGAAGWAAGAAGWAAGAAGWAAEAAGRAAGWAAGRAAGRAAEAAGMAAGWAAEAAGRAAGRAAEHKKMCSLIRSELRKSSFRRLA